MSAPPAVREKTVKVQTPQVDLGPADALFVLYSLEAGNIPGNFKLQKVGFWTALHLKLRKVRWPSFRFIRYRYGPYSAEFQTAFQELRRRGFISPDRHRVTDKGKFLLNVAVPTLREIPANAPIFEIAASWLTKCHDKSGTQLKRDSYKIQWIYGEKKDATLADLPHGVNLVAPSDLETGLTIPAWLSDFSAEYLATPDEAIEDARKRLPELNREALGSLRGALSASP